MVQEEGKTKGHEAEVINLVRSSQKKIITSKFCVLLLLNIVQQITLHFFHLHLEMLPLPSLGINISE